MDTQHAFDADGRTPRALGLGIDRLDCGHQVRPRHHAVHLGEKLLAASGFAILFERYLGKGLLVHEAASRSVLRDP